MRFLIDEIHPIVEEASGVRLSPADWATTPDRTLGDIAIPCFKIGKELQQNPAQVAATLCQKIQTKIHGSKFLLKAEAKGPYINFFFKTKPLFELLYNQIKKEPAKFGSTTEGNGKTIVIDFSSPNIAKEIALHHIRSTCIGHSLARIAQVHGYKVERLNYLGDWGTTHGKVILAIQKFAKEEDLKSKGLPYLLELYIQFNKAEKEDPKLSEEAKACFKRLEEGDPECRRIWQLYKNISIEGFKKTYEYLGITFDHFDGESLYEKALVVALEEVRHKIGTRESEGAEVVDIPGQKIPALLRKDDGASLYLTRDLAAAEDRYKRFHFDKSWYVVAIQQKLHFEQLSALLKMLGKPYADRVEHISFGMLSFGSKTMKTREGNVIILTDVLEEATQRALQIIREKNPNLPHAATTARQVGVGAIIFSDLSQHRQKDVSFSWDKALSFEGDTGPHLQYTHARCHSLIQKAQQRVPTLNSNISAVGELEDNPSVRQLVGDWGYFYTYSEKALSEKDPSQIATALLNISKSFNQLYHKVRFLDQESKEGLLFLVSLCEGTKEILRHGLWILGIDAPDEM